MVKKLCRKREYLLRESTHKQFVIIQRLLTKKKTEGKEDKKEVRAGEKTKYRGEHHGSRQHLRPVAA